VKRKVGRSAKLYKRARMCQFFKELGTALNLFSMEDYKNPIASRWQEQPSLKTFFISIL
jgi:hypothetical protein